MTARSAAEPKGLIIGVNERERCMYALSGGRWCGRPADHLGQHRSTESWRRILAHKRIRKMVR